MKKNLLMLLLLLILVSCKKDDTPLAAVVETPVVENPEGLLAVYKVLSTGEL